MFDLNAYSLGLAFMAAIAFAAWVVSVAKRNAGIVDSVWAVFFLVGAAVYAAAVPDRGPRSALILTLVAVWAARLSGYITWRNWGEPEDHRYQAIRRRNEPNFALKSVYLVFALQALLAWILSVPLLAGIASMAPLNPLDYGGIALWAFGFLFESIGDFQLARFKREPENRGKVMDRGLWRYTRHPNYFGEFCLWWGFYLIAAAAGGWWALVSPLLLSFLLLKVSGVALLEKDIGSRRTSYRDYIARTPAFFPGPSKRAPTAGSAR
jgi:steroid 5-alpha reductase family enzyme